MCGILISGSANRFSSFRSRKKISFHRPVSVREHRWNLEKGVLHHLWAILEVYLCIFFLKVIVKLDVDEGRFVRSEVYEVARVVSCFRLEAGLYPKEERKRQNNCGIRITKEYKVYVCVFVGHALRSTSFFLGVAKKSEVPIFSASTSLTYPSSICQAGTRTTTGDPWRCKLQRNKHELPVNTPSPNTHRLLVLQISPLHSERRQYIFFNCTSAILLALVEGRSLSIFF